MNHSAAFRARLEAAVGTAGILSDPADTAPYVTDWRHQYQGRAFAVVRPRSTDEVASVVHACNEFGMPIVPQGGNTGQCGGATPDASGNAVLLSLNRMTSVRAIDPQNATITVDAGVVLADVQQAAAQAGLYFPLSLGAEGTCTIGGNLSTNAGGTAVLRFGNARDLVLGIEVVLADGRVWDGLRGLRKDNSGYDLKQLFIAAEGTLGIITAAVLKLFPAPRSRATGLLAIADPDAALMLLAELLQELGSRLVGFELMSAFSQALSRKHFPALPDPLPGHPWYVLVQVEDSAADYPLAGHLERALERLLGQGLVRHGTIAQSETQAGTLWAIRTSIAEAQRREGPDIKHDISLPVSAIPGFLAEAALALRQAIPGARIAAFGHLGDGNLHYDVSAPEDGDSKAFGANITAVNHIVHDLCAARAGSISAEHGIGQLKRGELIRYKSAVELELMRRLKSALDPQAILNPGKLL